MWLTFLATPSLVFPVRPKPYFFDPLRLFGLSEPERPPASTLPLLLVLPGLDGSGITAWTQYPELGLDYEVRAMRISPGDRTTFDELVDIVADEVANERACSSADREIFVLGESMGAGIALHAATQRSKSASPDGLLLVSPATGWDRTWVGSARQRLVGLPDSALGLATLLTSYQLLDVVQLWRTVRRVVTGEKAPLLSSPERVAYAWEVVRAMPEAFSHPSSTVRHRIADWTEPTLAIGREATFSQLELPPVLIVAGTADLRVPAKEEALRLQACARGPCDVHLVETAGHAGALDDRVDLRDVMAKWRRDVVDNGRVGEEGGAGVGAVLSAPGARQSVQVRS